MVEWWLAWFTTLAAAALGWFWNWHVQRIAHRDGMASAEEVLSAARHEAEVLIREAQAQAKEVQNQAHKDF